MCEPLDSNLTCSVSHHVLDSGYHCVAFNLLVLCTTCKQTLIEVGQAKDRIWKRQSKLSSSVF
jgi:hypothetical protein